VRRRELLSLEEAVRLLTDWPASLRPPRRDRIAAGWHGDLVVFDPAAVGPGRHDTFDLPAAPGGCSPLPTASERRGERPDPRGGEVTDRLPGTRCAPGDHLPRSARLRTEGDIR
jgi:hypothetical protein